MSGQLEDRLKMFGRLPPIEPPAALEGRVLAAMAAAAGKSAPRHEAAAAGRSAQRHEAARSNGAPASGWRAAWRWPAHRRAAAWLVPIAGGVLLAALLVGQDRSDPARESISVGVVRPPLPAADTTADRARFAEARGQALQAPAAARGQAPAAARGQAPAAARGQAPATEALYRSLVERAEYLNFVLASMPRRHVMRVSTVGTIIGLEERLALIDAELYRAREAAPEYRTVLMLDRVDTMSALVNLRYAQSRAISF